MMVVMLLVVPKAGLAQWTFVGYVGDTWTAASTITLDNASAGTSVRVTDVEYESRAWERPLYWGVRAGLAVSRDQRWAVELEYIHLKVYASPEHVVHVQGHVDGRDIDEREPFRAIVERFQISHGLNLLLVNAAFEQRVHPRLTLTARAGIGPTVPHIEATIAGASRDQYSWGRVGVQAGGAVNWFATRHVFFTGELKWTFTHQRLAVGATQTDARFATAHLLAGVGIRLHAE